MYKSIRNLIIAVLALVLCVSLFGCSESGSGDVAENTSSDAGQETASDIIQETAYDYLVLVNKQNALPDNWEDVIELEESDNRWGETYQVEKAALAAFKELQKDLLENDGIIIELDSTYRSVKRQQEIWDEFEAEKGI